MIGTTEPLLTLTVALHEIQCMKKGKDVDCGRSMGGSEMLKGVVLSAAVR